MNRRRNSGATLALIIASTVIVVIVGVGLFLVARLLGGHRELQNATDSGSLNVAKQALIRPNTGLNGTVEQQNFRLLTENVDGADVIDLKVYNRLVGQALLVAINAEADGGTAGKDDAAALIDVIEQPDGIGDRLAKQLGAKSGTLDGFFMDLGKYNGLRMLGANALNNDASRDAVAWMEQRPTDVGATNILAPSAEQIPPNGKPLPASYLTTDPASGTTYVRGYRQLKFDLGARGSRTLIGVPTQPGAQPHLVAYADFDVQRDQSFNPGGVAKVPPNAFQSSGATKDSLTKAVAQTNARSLIGVLGAQYPPTIPGGYIAVQNGTEQLDYHGTMANFNTVLNGQLDGGILVNPKGYFTADPGLLGAWATHNQTLHYKKVPIPGQPGKFNKVLLCPNDGPPIADLYDAAGNAVSRVEAHKIHQPAAAICNDHNTFPPGEDAAGRKICDNLLISFEKAYTPGFTGYQQNIPGTSTNLTAVESLKADLEHLFNHCGVLRPSNKLESGMRFYKYPCTGGSGPLDCPWPQNATTPGGLRSNFPQVSYNGNLTELVSFASGDPSGKGTGAAPRNNVQQTKAFLKQRLAQISGKSGADLDKDVTFVMKQGTLPLGKTSYIYYTYPAKPTYKPSDAQLQFTTTPPPTVSGQTPDGTPFPPYQHQYRNIIGTKVNSRHEHEVDKNPFQRWSGSIAATETVSIQPSSGFNNLLGVIRLTEQAALTPKSGPYFCEPD